MALFAAELSPCLDKSTGVIIKIAPIYLSMLKAEWFNIPLERQLTLIKISNEIDECDDIKSLRESLKSVVKQNAQFQQMLGELLKEQLTGEVEKFFGEFEEEVKRER